jgi:putative endonuclease
MDLVRFIAGLFCRLNKRSFPSPEHGGNPQQWLGHYGEQRAAKYLRKQGYKILYRNYRAPHGGEVDLVCRDKRVLVFVEVKTRRSLRYGTPASAVDLKKQRLIARGALAWLRLLHFPEIPFRFDIVEVVHDEIGTSINLVQNAFELPEPYVYSGLGKGPKGPKGPK